MLFYSQDITNMFIVGIVAIVVILLGVVIWLAFSKSVFAQKWRAKSPDEQTPHVHDFMGVIIMHEHRNGHKKHTHDTITVSTEEYVMWKSGFQDGRL